MSHGIRSEMLYEVEGEIIELETVHGNAYKGRLIKGDDASFCVLSEVTATLKDGIVKNYKNIVINGWKIRFAGLPSEKKDEKPATTTFEDRSHKTEERENAVMVHG